jgi:hypothetical protein
VIFARTLAGLAAGFLLATSGAFAVYGWRSGLGCLACGVVAAVLSFDVDRVTRKSRWQARDAQRAAQALRDAQTGSWADITAAIVELRGA